jgi:hypothetical protein
MLHTFIIYLLVLFSVPWAVRTRHLPAWLVLLCGITVLYFIVIPGAAGQARFRIPIEPMLASMAGFGWLYLRGILRRAPIKRVGAERERSGEDNV